jgi:hypothetical protein
MSHRPPGGDIGDGEGEAELALGLPALVADQVDLDEPGQAVAPYRTEVTVQSEYQYEYAADSRRIVLVSGFRGRHGGVSAMTRLVTIAA